MLQLTKDLPFWLRLWLVFPLAFLNGWLFLLLFSYLQPLASLLVTAIILAFLLNFPIQILQRRGIQRFVAISIVLSVALVVLGILGLTLVPLIVDQLSGLVASLPTLIDSGIQQIEAIQQWAIAQRLPANIGEVAEREIEQLSGILQATSSQLLSFILGTINSLINIFLLLVLTIFMVLNGERSWQGIFSWLPTHWSQPLQTSLQQTFQNYFAAQALLAGILSAAQTIAFVALGVPYAVLFGVSIGLTTLIPYASTVMVVVVSVLVALQDFTLGLKVLASAITIGLINDNVVSPRLVGSSIGLNPIWLIIALFIGGKVAGVLGLVIAVPIASVIKRMADAMRSPLDTDSDRMARTTGI
ncbi:AI-2E family transporter [Altericista sp. CCNU0014]|uniref:AI-2E family transporter n=1 Tax=Altericista sp. CCNU0014 TaxID=3082949 RepID=UPI00384ABFE4